MNKFDTFKHNLAITASEAIRRIPLSQHKMSELTGVRQCYFSYLKNMRGKVSVAQTINIMMKLGYSVEIKFTRIES